MADDGTPVELGRVGVWLGLLGWQPAAAEREIVAELEELGYATLWLSESHTNKESLSHAAIVLAASSRLVVATGIANIWVRDPMAMTAGGNSLAEAFPGRFVLGIGVSHAPQLAPRGIEYKRPVATMRAYVEAMDAADYEGPRPAAPLTRVLGALRPPMLELAAELTDGAHPYLVPVEHTARAREILGPSKLLAPELFVLFERDPAEARRLARDGLAWYMTLPNYTESLRWCGFDESDWENGASDRLIDAVVAWGDEAAIRERVRQHLDAGADHVCVQPIGRRAGDLGIDQLRALAPALRELG